MASAMCDIILPPLRARVSPQRMREHGDSMMYVVTLPDPTASTGSEPLPIGYVWEPRPGEWIGVSYSIGHAPMPISVDATSKDLALYLLIDQELLNRKKRENIGKAVRV